MNNGIWMVVAVLIVIISSFLALFLLPILEGGIIGLTFLISYFPALISIAFIDRYLRNYCRHDASNTEERTILNAFHGIKGDWKMPVLSYNEREILYAKIHWKFRVLDIVLGITGSVLIVIDFLFIPYIFFIALGTVLISCGIIIDIYTKFILKKFLKKEPIEILAPARFYTPVKGPITVERLLNTFNEQYNKEIIFELILRNFWVKKYKYIFDNGNYIVYGYSKRPGQKFISAVWIGYYYLHKNVQHARTLLERIDRFLVDIKKIRLYEKNKPDASLWSVA
jgi:hypothetical protein